MELIHTAMQNLLSPVILFFLVGLLAGVFKSSLTIPPSLGKTISLYLVMAIGFRGGVELAHTGVSNAILAAIVLAVALSAGIPFLAYALLRLTTKVDRVNAAVVAAHYGSVSVVTFATAVAILGQLEEYFEPYVVALLAVKEAPAILSGLLLAKRRRIGARTPAGIVDLSSSNSVVRQVLLHGSVMLLLGSFLAGWITGPKGLVDLSPVFVDLFKGVLCLFLLDMGLVVARRISDLKRLSFGLVAFGLYMPLIGAAAGLGCAWILGLSPGGATLLAVLAASASYIVVPAVMRTAVPEASPAIYITLALGITFPFNLVVGIPLYHYSARLLMG